MKYRSNRKVFALGNFPNSFQIVFFMSNVVKLFQKAAAVNHKKAAPVNCNPQCPEIVNYDQHF